MNLESFPRLGFDPFSIYVSYVLLEKRRVFQLAGKVSQCNMDLRTVFRAGRTGGIF